MSPELFNRSPDLRRLRDEGYFVQIRGGLLLVGEVPYVDSNRQIRKGLLISSLELAGDVTTKPGTHTVHWAGDFPCNADGVPLKGIGHNIAGEHNLGSHVVAQYIFSSKPDENGYPDYFVKMSTYATIISGPAAVLQPSISPRIFRAPDELDGPCVFNYIDTASDRAGIGALAEKLDGEILSIIGTGGSGAYILDFVAKTRVKSIRLFDADNFLQHNAFRAPGAPSLEELREAPKKVHYFGNIYSKMHRGIDPHAVMLNADNLELLNGTTFAFISMDAGEAKRVIVGKLEALNIPFIDVGMGLELVGGSLGGIIRVTTSTQSKRDHIGSKISFCGGGADDIYSSNIQIAELNALCAVLAVIKWKKLRGFYRDLDKELHCTYTTDGNLLLNSDGEDEDKDD